MTSVKISKQCGYCGKVFKYIPTIARVQHGSVDEQMITGYFFDCVCENTIYVPIKHIFEKMAVS